MRMLERAGRSLSGFLFAVAALVGAQPVLAQALVTPDPTITGVPGAAAFTGKEWMNFRQDRGTVTAPVSTVLGQVISSATAATAPAGSELVSCIQGGSLKGCSVNQVADPVKVRLRRAQLRGRLPVAMATAPTIATPATAATLPNRYAYNTGAFTYLGGTWVADTTNNRISPATVDLAGSVSAYTDPNSATRQAYASTVNFITDGAAFEIEGYWSTTAAESIRILVLNPATGGWEIAGIVQNTTSSTTRTYVPVTFSAALPAGRSIRIEAGTSFKLAAVRVAATATIWPYTPPVALKGIGFGDSYFGVGGLTYAWDSQCVQLGYLLGIDDWRCSSSGGTGLSAVNGAAVNFKDRFASDVVNQGPFDVAWVGGSGNDYNQPTATVTANLGTMLDQLHTAAPQTLTFVSGSWQVNTSNVNAAARTAVTAAIQSALTTRTWVNYIDMSSWITGTGYTGATTGDGNADAYVYSDDIHPTVAGHAFRAQREAVTIRGLAQVN